MEEGISVIIATANRGEQMSTILAHLEQQTFPAAQFEVIVVIDADESTTKRVVQRHSEGAPIRIRCYIQNKRGRVTGENRGIREAKFNHVLFLRDDLLAAPHLLERHYKHQLERPEGCAILGGADPHPQMPTNTLTRNGIALHRVTLKAGQPIHYLDWNSDNLSLPTRYLLEANGFDETCPYPYMEARELGWRLQSTTIPAFYEPQCRAYEWLGTTMDEGRDYAYQRGYALYWLAERTRAIDIYKRYTLVQNPLRNFIQWLLMPFYIRACRQSQDKGQPLFRFIQRIYNYEMRRGFNDAARGKPPQ